MAKSTRRQRRKKTKVAIEKNRVRGLIGAAKSRGYSADRQSHLKQFQTGIAGVFLEARSTFGGNQIEPFIEWVNTQSEAMLGPVLDCPSDSQLTSNAYSSTASSLENELRWIVARLEKRAQRISDFRKLALAVEDAYWNADKKETYRLLDKIEQTYGVSLWSVEARITLEQSFEGLAAQKSTLERIRREHPKSVIAYVAYYVSLRNEPTAILERAREEIAFRIEKLDVPAHMKEFLRFKLTWAITDRRSGMSQVLHLAQSLSDIDLYETFVAACQHLLGSQLSASRKKFLKECVQKFHAISDIRIQRIQSLLDNSLPEPGQETQRESSKCLHSGDLVGALRNSLTELRSNPRAISSALNAAIALSQSPRIRQTEVAGWSEVVRALARTLQFSDSFESDFHRLEKLLRNKGVFPTALCMVELIAAHIRSPLQEDERGLLLAYANDVEEYTHDDLVPSIAELRATNLQLYGRGNRNLIPENPFDLYVELRRQVRLNSPLVAPLAQAGMRSNFRPLMLHAAIVLIATQLDDDDYANGVTNLVGAYLNLGVPLTLLPFDKGLAGARWPKLRALKGNIALPIALHLCNEAKGTDLVASNLRISFDEFIAFHHCRSATQLHTVSPQFERIQLIYFLQEVCVQGVIDMSESIESSRAAEEERRSICSLLCEINPEHHAQYEDEILRIVQALSTEDALRVVDRSRLYVDVEAIRARIKLDWQPAFDRYVGLIEAGIGTAEKFDDVFRAISKSGNISSKYLQLPESEADQILVELALNIKSRFLLDPEHGLDSYLSRRIRHHSVIGSLRGPVDEYQLITIRDHKTSRYVPNVYWTSRMGLNASEQEKVVRAFEQFSEEFDKIVLTLKEKILHVKNAEHPEGIFDIPFPPAAYHLLRSAIQQDLTLEGFVKMCFSLFWGGLDTSLNTAKQLLESKTKAEVSTAFQRLRANLLKALSNQSRYPELSQAIGNAHENVLRELAKVSEWFTRPGKMDTSVSYSLEKVLEIALKSALSSHRPFAPKISSSVQSDYEVRVQTMIVLAEIILTAMGNVRQHSKTRNAPEVTIELRCKKGDDALLLHIESEIDSCARSREVEQKVELIRKQIGDRSYVAKVRSEGGSGLMKIASVVHQSNSGSIDFGFNSSNRFFLDVRLSFIPESM
jgi:hypothetical protein